MCKKFGLFLVTFQKKKGKEENNILFLYNYIYCVFHVMIHFSFCVCVIPFYISVSHAEKKKNDDRPF